MVLVSTKWPRCLNQDVVFLLALNAGRSWRFCICDSFSSFGTWPLPPSSTQKILLNVLTFIHSANHVMPETRHSSKVNAPILQGQILKVTFQGTLWPFPTQPTSPPSSHRWSIHHTDRMLDLTFALSWAFFSGGGAWDRRTRNEAEGKAHKLCWPHSAVQLICRLEAVP